MLMSWSRVVAVRVTRETRVSSYLKDMANHAATGLNMSSEEKEKSQEDPQGLGPCSRKDGAATY